MKFKILAVIAACSFLSACQTTGSTKTTTTNEWKKIHKGESFDVADSKCKTLSQNERTEVIAIGRPAFIIGAHIANEIGNAVRKDAFYKRCMTVKGWQKVAVTKTVTTPATKPAAKPAAKAGGKAKKV